MAGNLARSIASRLACIPNSNKKIHNSLDVMPILRRHGMHLARGAATTASSGVAVTNDDKTSDESVGGRGTIKGLGREVTVTRSRSSNDASTIIKPHTGNDSMELVEKLLARTTDMMDPRAANVVAYSGGVDSSLVAALVHRAFSNYQTIRPSSTRTVNNANHRDNSHQGSVQAVLGISPAVPQSQIIVARQVAENIGIALAEVATAESSDATYQRNDGYACYVCKTHLYSTLETVAQHIEGQQQQNHSVILYNGTNADDREDPTRLGLIAASNFQVHSPLDQITKEQVRQAAKYLGLQNWNAAASPCLRSRLAMGVNATAKHLKAVEMAEEFVRRVLVLDETINARVRMLSGGKAMVELDHAILGTNANGGENWATRLLREHGFEEKCIGTWGFNSFGGVRGFKTGSVAAMPTEDSQPLASVAS